MAFSKDELDQLQNMMVSTIVDVVGPMFVQQTEELGGRIDRVEGRMDGLETGLADFQAKTEQHFSSIEQRLRELNQKIDDQTATLKDRIENMSEDIDLLAQLATKLDNGTKAERDFAKLTLEHQVPILFRQLQAIAKKAGVKLPA